MEDFKLPRSSYDELAKIIMAYGRNNGKEASLDDIAQSTGINKSVVSSNNGFLTSAGIIEGGNKKVITSVGSELARAISLDYEEEIEKAWRDVVRENEFLIKMVSAVEIRKGMELSQFVTHIIFSAGQQSNRNSNTGARAVVDVLLASGLVEEKDGKIVPVKSSNSVSEEKPKKEEEKTQARESTESEKADYYEEARETRINLNVNLVINANPDQLDGLGERIRKVFEELQENNSADKDLTQDS